MPSVVDFDGAGVGTCLVWHLSFEDGLQGAEVGMNANDLVGCYSLSNPIEVLRDDCGNVDCVDELQEDANPLAPGLYEAISTINSAGTASTGSVDFSAGVCIELQPGFEVIQGSEFNAFIEGCDNAVGPLLESEEK